MAEKKKVRRDTKKGLTQIGEARKIKNPIRDKMEELNPKELQEFKKKIR